MEAQREDARKAWKGSGEAKTETIWFELRERFGATEFLGYDTETAEGIVRAIVVDGKEVDSLDAGPEGRDRRQPDAVLWRVRRPDRRPWRDPHGRGRGVPRHRHAEAGGRS